jgi:hypothetical protein
MRFALIDGAKAHFPSIACAACLVSAKDPMGVWLAAVAL